MWCISALRARLASRDIPFSLSRITDTNLSSCDNGTCSRYLSNTQHKGAKYWWYKPTEHPGADNSHLVQWQIFTEINDWPFAVNSIVHISDVLKTEIECQRNNTSHVLQWWSYCLWRELFFNSSATRETPECRLKCRNGMVRRCSFPDGFMLYMRTMAGGSNRTPHLWGKISRPAMALEKSLNKHMLRTKITSMQFHEYHKFSQISCINRKHIYIMTSTMAIAMFTLCIAR